MKVKANTDFVTHFVGGGSFEIKKGDTFDLVNTYVAFPSKVVMAVIHRKNTAPFAVYLDNLDVLEY